MYRYLFRSFGLVYKIKKSWIIVTLFFRIINGLIPLMELWILQSIIDQVSAFINDNGHLAPVFKLILLQFSIMMIKSSINEYMTIKDKEMQQTLDYHMGKNIMNKLMSVPYQKFEIPTFYNHQFRIKNNYGARFLRPITNILEALQNFISILGYIGFLFTAHWMLVIMGVVVAIPTFFIQYKFGSFRFNLLKAQSGKLREANYIYGLIGNKQSTKEIRLFNLGENLIDKWGEIILNNNAKVLNILRRQKKANIKLDMFTSFLYVAGALLTIYIIKTSKISIGKFVTVIQSLSGLQQTVNHSSYLLAVILESSLYIKDYFEFIDYEDNEFNPVNKRVSNSPKDVLSNRISINNLYYKYPLNDNYSLKDISLNIKTNEKVAIVGNNGSGKSTLIKILSGLYSPSKGTIFFGDKEINDIEEKNLRENITVIFQDFVRFPYSIEENIAFSNIADINNTERIRSVANITGVDKLVKELPNGYKTNLGKILPNSIDISGGEWQKIAISRALFKNSKIIVLDEPTASIDPVTELEIFNQFVELVKNKTAIFITHRMAAARVADRIFVMNNGEIVEVGSHEELMEKRGNYYNMFESQSVWYK